jgi:hypothetical protein
MARECTYCGEAKSRSKGKPMYYDAIDEYAHVECARENDINLGE